MGAGPRPPLGSADLDAGSPPVTLDDRAIVDALLDGEPGSWDYFVACYAGLATGVVRRILLVRGGRASAADVDDVVENLFVMLLERDGALLRKYDPRYKLSAFVAVLARTAVHRWLRRQKVKVPLPDEMFGESLADEPERTISEQTTHRELRDALREVLHTLPERDQQVLRLFYFEDQDYQAIAQALGVSVNSVGAALSRARTRLATALKDHRELTESDWRSI